MFKTNGTAEPLEPTLTGKVVRGGVWVFGIRFVNQLFYFARLVILARLLAPRDFGLFGIAMFVLGILDTVSQPGLQQAIIQKKDNSKDYLDAAWTVIVIRGIALSALMWFLAPSAARFFNVPEARNIIQIMSLSIFIQAFTNISIVSIQKEMQFHKQFIYQVAISTVDFTVAVVAAFLLRNPWALVLGVLAGQTVGLIVSYAILPYRPRFHLDFRKVLELTKFGRWVFAANILIFAMGNGDDAFVGKVLGAVMLGFYQMAYRISNTPWSEITRIVSQVTFPAFSKIQENVEKLKESYMNVLHLSTFFAFPVAGLLLALAPEFTRLVLGAKWMPIVPALRILCVFGLFSSINSSFSPVFYAIGRPSIMTKNILISLVTQAVLIYPLTKALKLPGTALTVVLANLVCLIVMLRHVEKSLGLRTFDILRKIGPHAGMTVVITGLVFLTKALLGGHLGLPLTFLASLFIGLGVYLFYGRSLIPSFRPYWKAIWR
jgi:O-antigen/teichoic acid export membrane protein